MENPETILDSNPIRLLNLNKYRLTEEQTQDEELVRWTKEVIGEFTTLRMYPQFRQTVNPFVYALPTSMKLKKYGARHFVMKEQCAMNDEEIAKLRAEAPNKYSPYWYGMISTCHHSGHIGLKIAQMLFPSVKWRIVQTMSHTFVTNMSLDNIKNTFSNNSGLSRELNEGIKRNSIQKLKERIASFVSIMQDYIVDNAEFDESAPMIIDILATDKQTFLNLVSISSAKYIQSYNSPQEFRQKLLNWGNLKNSTRKCWNCRKGGKRCHRKITQKKIR
jgi:hypothetical protein